MQFDYMMRQNQGNDVMAGIISTPDEINHFLDMLEMLAMKNSKIIFKKLDQLLKTVFAEQEHSIDKLKLLFARIKSVLKRIRDFLGKLNQVDVDELLFASQDKQVYLPIKVEVTRRQQFECLIQVLDFYSQVFSMMGSRQAQKVGIYEKWDAEIETLMWIQTLFQQKQNQVLLRILKDDASEIRNLADTKYFKKLQENIKSKQSEKVAIDESHIEFLENLQSVRTEVEGHIQKAYCVFSNKLEEPKLL